MAANASEPTEPPVTVELRDVTADDLPIFFAHRLDPVACQMVGFPARDRASFMAHWERNLANTSNRHRTIVVDGRVAGSMVAFTQDDMREVGYWLGREFWGRGIATRALAAFLLVETAAPLPAGFWDRRPQPTPGRLRRGLARLPFPHDFPLPARIREQASPTAHLPKGFWGQRRTPAPTSAPTALAEAA